MLPIHFHNDPLAYKTLSRASKVNHDGKIEEEKVETPVYYMSSISSCSKDLSSLASMGQASFKSSYHIGMSRMDAIVSTKSPPLESRDIEEEEFVYSTGNKSLKRRTFISTTYTTGRPLAQCYSGSNKRRKFCDLDEISTQNDNTSWRYKETLYDDDDEVDEGDENNHDGTGWRHRREQTSSYGAGVSLSRSFGSDVCRGLADATSLIESFANPSLLDEDQQQHDGEREEESEETLEVEVRENNGELEGADYFVDSPGENEGNESECESESETVHAIARGWKIPSASATTATTADSGSSEQLVIQQQGNEDEDQNRSGSFLGGLEWF